MMQLRHNYNKITQPIFVALFIFVGAFLVTTLTSHSFTPVGDSSALDSEVNVEIEPSLSLAIMDKDPTSSSDATTIDTMSMEVTPNASGAFISSTAYVVAGSNNETGYTLSFSDTDNNTALEYQGTVPAGTGLSTTIPSISSPSSSLTDIDANQWGYAFNTDTVFSPIPALSSPTTLVSTTERGSHTYPFTAASKIDMNILAGTYQDSLTFTLVANYVPPLTWKYNYTGSAQTFTAPKAGKYQIELWGAGVTGGGYTSGVIELAAQNTLYLYIGQWNAAQGQSSFNGGGTALINSSTQLSGYNGGGATDIRTISGNWNNLDSLRSRIMVAGGSGAGNDTANTFGFAGGLAGYDGVYTVNPDLSIYYGYAGTQIAGGQIPTKHSCGISNGTAGTFGVGGNGGASANGALAGGGSAGGGGWYGGSGSSGICNGVSPGGGGSSYISGHAGSIAVTSSSNTTPKCSNGATSIACSESWTGYIFTDTVMIDGLGYSWTAVKGAQAQMPNPAGGYYPLGQGHTGNGYARITYIGR